MNTAPLEKLQNELCISIKQGGKLLAVPGVVRSGKTTFLQYLQNKFEQGGEIIVARSLALEKDKVKISTLMTALFLDLTTQKISRIIDQKIIKLQKLIQEQGKPVVLFIDDAHDLNTHTLSSLPDFIETVNLQGGCLSILLMGQPQLIHILETLLTHIPHPKVQI